MKQSAQRVQQALAAQGLDLEVREFPASTKTAAEAAVTGASPLEGNAYKVAITKTLVRRALLSNSLPGTAAI